MNSPCRWPAAPPPSGSANPLRSETHSSLLLDVTASGRAGLPGPRSGIAKPIVPIGRATAGCGKWHTASQRGLARPHGARARSYVYPAPERRNSPAKYTTRVTSRLRAHESGIRRRREPPASRCRRHRPRVRPSPPPPPPPRGLSRSPEVARPLGDEQCQERPRHRKGRRLAD